MKYVDIRGLPPCTLSSQCLRLLDDLDSPPTARAPARLLYIDDLQDERQLRQLRSHVSSCPTCSTLLADARHMRTHQRTMLHHFLIANEQRVPATTEKIFAALRQEQAQQETEKTQTKRVYTRVLALASARQPAPPDTPLLLPLTLPERVARPRNLIQHVITLATVVAIIVAAAGLLNRITNSTSPANTHVPPHPEAGGISDKSWDSVIIGLTLLSATSLAQSFTVYNFNTTNNQWKALLTSSQERSDIHLEEISKDGQNLLYTMTSPVQQTTTYATYSEDSGAHAFYHLGASLAGDALWMDADHVLAQDTQGFVLDLDVQSNVVQHTWPLKAGQLTFYHAPFLYFTHAEGASASALYRLNLTQPSAVPQQVTAALPKTHFWLSPDGTTIFYTRANPSGSQDTYAIDSNGTRARLLYSGPGMPIGYAEDDSLMMLEQAGQKLQVVKLSDDVRQPAQVVLSDAAPQATSLCGPANIVIIIALCDQNIALAPYGHGLLLNAYYANGSHSLVYDDLTNGTSHKIFTVPEDATVQLPGWSRMFNAA